MLGLVIIDMQKWMFRYPERAAQIDLLVANINAVAKVFERELPIFDVQTIHKADRSTWSRLMHKHDYPCLIEGTEDARLVDGYRLSERAVQITKSANSAFLGTLRDPVEGCRCHRACSYGRLHRRMCRTYRGRCGPTWF